MSFISAVEATVAIPCDARIDIAVSGDEAESVYKKVVLAVRKRMPCSPIGPAADHSEICYLADRYTPTQAAGVFRVFLAKRNLPPDSTEATVVVVEVNVYYQARRVDVEPVITDLFTSFKAKYKGWRGVKEVNAYDDCENYSYDDRHRICGS